MLLKLFSPTVRRNYYSDREKLLKLEAEGLQEQFIETVKGQNASLPCLWRFFTSNKLEQLKSLFYK